MKKSWLIAALLLATAPAALAQDEAELPRYGVAVWNADGEFMASKWPELSTFVLGSSDDSLIDMPGLDPRHAEFQIATGEMKVVPIGEVRIDGNQVFTPTRIFPGQEIRLGAYKVKLFLNASDDPDPSAKKDPAATAEEEDGVAIDPVSAGELAADARKPEFANELYRFCHDPEFGKDGTEGVDFCSLFDETSEDVCPAAQKNCAQWKHAPLVCLPVDGSGKQIEGQPGPDDRVDAKEGVCPGGSQGKTETGKSRIVRRESKPTMLPRLPAEVGWILIGLLVAFAVFWFVKSLKDAGWESKQDLSDESAVLTEAERNLQALPEARSSTLLKLATRALSRGDAKEAAILVHLAALRFLDDEGLARYHPSKTNGDYLRSIRRHKPLAALFRSAANSTERIRFGDGNVDPDRVASDINQAERLLVKGTGNVEEKIEAPSVALGVFFALMVSQQACVPGETNDPAFSSREPTGMAALPVLLRESGMKVTIGRSRKAEIAPDVGVIVVRSSASSRGRWPQDLKIDALLDRDLSIVVLDDLWQSRFFLPVTASVSKSRGAVELAMTAPSPRMFCEWRLHDLSLAAGEGAIKVPYGRRLLWDQQTRTATASAVTGRLELHPFLVYEGQPLIDKDPAGVAWVAERVEGGTSLSGCIYVFSDRDLFTNASLTREPNARFVAAFFAALTRDGRGVMIMDRVDALGLATSDDDDEKDKEEQTNPAAPLKASNMLPFIAQAALALIVLYVMLGAAFGPLRDPAKVEHKAFIEHVEAIGRQYARTGVMGLTHAARSLARLVVMRNRDQIRGGPGGGWGAVAQHLAQKLQLDEKDVRAALRLGIDGTSELGAPTPEDPSPSSEKMLRALSRLLGGKTAPQKKRTIFRREDEVDLGSERSQQIVRSDRG